MGAYQTVPRIAALINLPQLQMLGGIQPNSWLGPWISDSLLGILTPIMAYLAYKKRGIKLWGMLLIFNGLGAFDYIFGFAAQWSYPFISEKAMEAPAMIYGTLVSFFTFQVSAIVLLFRRDVVNYFSQSNVDRR